MVVICESREGEGCLANSCFGCEVCICNCFYLFLYLFCAFMELRGANQSSLVNLSASFSENPASVKVSFNDMGLMLHFQIYKVKVPNLAKLN